MYKFAIPAACLLLATLLTACGGDYQAKKEELEELKEKYNALATQAESWQALSETERAKKHKPHKPNGWRHKPHCSQAMTPPPLTQSGQHRQPQNRPSSSKSKKMPIKI